MTPERWERVDRLLDEALTLAPGERAAHLDRECAGDPELRREVESLLGHAARAGGFIESSPAAAALLADLEPARLAPGARVGRYEVEALLGAGGMGEVYLAEDTRLRRRVALKLLPAELAGDRERRARFEREARAASALNHPNVCVVHDVDATGDGRLFIAMEFVDGVTMRDRLAGGAVPPDEALRIARQVAAALSAAHAEGIVHRDLKPENLMLREDGFVKVLDFGLAKLAEARAADSRASATGGVSTEAGAVMGTARYMSPEQARGEGVDARSDVFSFGAVLYELLTGEQAFRRASAVDTLHAIIHDEPAGLAALGRAVPAGVDRVLRRCLEKDAGARYANGSELAAALEQAAESSRSSGAVPAQGGRRRLLALAGAVALAGGGAWWGFSRSPAGAEPNGARPERASEAALPEMTVTPLTGLAGRACNPSFSPDGSQVAFDWIGDGENVPHVYLKIVDGGTPKRLTTSADLEMSPVWSPDGRSVAFTRASGEKRTIVEAPAIGGSERTLLTANCGWYNWGSRIDRSPDGELIAYSDMAVCNTPQRIYLLTVATQQTRQLTSPPDVRDQPGDEQPAFSPDGRTLAFVRFLSYATSDVYVVPVAGGDPTRLTFDGVDIGGLAWTPDGRSIVFSSNRGGAYGLWRIPATGGKPERLGVGSDNALHPAISRQGQHLAYMNRQVTTSTWRVDLADSPGKAGSPAKILSAAVDDCVFPRISSDGERIVFGSARSGANEVWVCNADGSNLLQLTTFRRPVGGSPYWSPDGRSIAFDMHEGEQSDIYVIGAGGGLPRRLTDDPALDMLPSWSRDGRWIYFSSTRRGEGQIWRMPAEGGEAVQVTRHGGSTSTESPDGRYLYFGKPRINSGVWRIPVEGGEEELVIPEVDPVTFRVTDKGIYFLVFEEKDVAVDLFSFATRKVTRVTTVAPSSYLGFTVSPDGRWLLYTQTDSESQNLMLAENFR